MNEILLTLMLAAAKEGKISEENFEEMKSHAIKIVAPSKAIFSDLKSKIENAKNLINDIEGFEKTISDATSTKELIESAINFNNAFEKFDKAEKSRELKLACEMERLDM